MQVTSMCRAVLAAVCLFLLPTFLSQSGFAQAKSRTVPLSGSRTGTAVFEDAGGNKTRITIKLANGTVSDNYKASIVFGVCSDPGGPAFQLTQMKSGVSTTVLSVAFSVFSDGDRTRYAISLPVACGDFAAQGSGQ